MRSSRNEATTLLHICYYVQKRRENIHQSKTKQALKGKKITIDC